MAEEKQSYNMSFPAGEINEKLSKVTTGDLALVDFGETVLKHDKPVVFPDGVEAALNAAIDAKAPFMLKVNANSDGMILPITTVATIAVMGEDVIVASTFGPYGILLGRVGGAWSFRFEKTDPGEASVQSVNGQTGEVQLSAADVGARPDDWMPTAQEVGALPNTYTPPNQTAEQVGADPKGTAASAVSQHNTADDSHNDIRLELKAINDRLTAFFDSDNQTLDELSEIVAYITSNKSLIDAITTSKVSVTDIVNNLATNVANKPLSAAQGVVLKGLIDTLSGNLANYQPKGDYALKSELPAVPVKSVNGKTGAVSLGASDVGALPSSELPAAINTALAQAKESGQFDGDPGAPGVSPHIGANGNWYIGSADTGVKAQGAAGRGIKSMAKTAGTGAAGTTDTYTITYTDNTTSTISVYNGKNGTNGTSVTVQSVSESTEDGGSNVVTFSDGKTLNVKNGKAGTPGKNPVRGTDYWTDEDRQEIVEEVSDKLAINNALPDYWLTHLSAKIPSINTAMETAGRSKSAFYFYTDAHRISSANMTPAILHYLYRHTSIQKTNNGGDFFEPFATGADNLATMRNYMADMRGVSNHHSVIGNHDEDNESLVTDAQLYGFYLAWEESNDIVWGGYHYYYIDNKSENTRYLYLDIGKNLGKSVAMVSNKQMQFVIDSLDSLPEGWHVIPIAHIWYDYEISALPDYVLNLLSVFDAYNGRTAGLVTHNGNTFAYDFAEALGNVEFCIGGHVHADQLYYSNGGIPIVIVDADSTAKKGSAATLGTITEGCVTAVVADYNTRKIKLIRIGRGSDRTIDIPTYGKAEIVNILNVYDVQYNKRYSPSSQGYKDDLGVISFLIPWSDVWEKTIYFKGFSNLTSKGSQPPAWRGIKGTTNYGFTGVTNYNIFTSPNLQQNNGVYSIAVNGNTISATADTFDYLQVQFVLNSTGTAIGAADLANCIMTIDQPIE